MDEQPAYPQRHRRWITWLECALILAVSLLAEMTHFSSQQGRAVICADSAQYVATAEAMVHGDRLPHFEMRKPGYSLFLAAILLTVGQLGWPVVVAQHAMLALLPLIAYGFGRIVHSRMLGWLAAMMVLAKLQTAIYGQRIMSESLFAVLLSMGMLLLATGLMRKRYVCWFTGTGLMLGLAWLTRGNATPMIAATVLFMIYWLRSDRRKLMLTLTVLGIPIAMCVAFECGLNGVLSGRWRPSNGTAGALLTLRMRYYDGVDLPNTVATAGALRWLPERSMADAYLSSPLDVWVARYRAIHDGGMNEWTYDDSMAAFGRDMVLSDLGSYARHTLSYGLSHLLRQPQHLTSTSVPAQRRKSWIAHPASAIDSDAETYWYAYWGLPHLTLDESIVLVDRMKVAARTRAPFGDEAIWKNFRYYLTRPLIDGALHALRWLDGAWPALGLLVCFVCGVNRKLYTLVAVVWLAEALFVGLITPTLDRLQFTWLVVDSTMAAALLAIPLAALVSRYSGQTEYETRESTLELNTIQT